MFRHARHRTGRRRQNRPPAEGADVTRQEVDLLRRLNSHEVREHTGGPETEGQVVARHERCVRGPGRLADVDGRATRHAGQEVAELPTSGRARQIQPVRRAQAGM
ncbi:hypothetical protein ABGB16_10170 [Micromonospora sp. B11E3]|uniref:hypothetical protein n=1 Tax=Micromonospora sp. B11E3 TaxID=3153562 RepID=UPI00325E01BD